MILDTLTIFAGIGIGFATARYVFYIRDVFWRGVRPHVFTWLIWGILNGVVAAAQFVSGGGPGAWITGYLCIMCFVISTLALFRGTKDITFSDWVCLLAALCAIVAWIFTSNPLTAVIIALLANAFGYIPTFRKSIKKPDEESALGFGIASARSIFAVLALASWNPTTLLHPIFSLIMDGGGALFILYRRKVLKAQKLSSS